MNENKHLTLDERNFIEHELAKNTNFKEIARYLGKNPTTISKEIIKHRIRKDGQAIHVNFNHCAKKFNCHRRNLCNPRCVKECGQFFIFTYINFTQLILFLVLNKYSMI